MIIAIFIIAFGFYWLMRETDYLTIRLLVGKVKPVKPKYARYTAYNYLKKRSEATTLRHGNNYPEDYSPNGEPEYSVMLSPGIDNVLCGWDWLDQHCAAMVDYQPEIHMAIGNVRYDMTIKQPSVLKDVMRVNKLTKKQVRALAY